MSTLEPALQNGGVKVVLIENFRGQGIVAWHGKTERFPSLDEAQAFIKRKKLEIVTSYIKGSKAFRDIQRGQAGE